MTLQVCLSLKTSPNKKHLAILRENGDLLKGNASEFTWRNADPPTWRDQVFGHLKAGGPRWAPFPVINGVKRGPYKWMFPKIGGKTPKMVDLIHGKPYFLVDDLG